MEKHGFAALSADLLHITCPEMSIYRPGTTNAKKPYPPEPAENVVKPMGNMDFCHAKEKTKPPPVRSRSWPKPKPK